MNRSQTLKTRKVNVQLVFVVGQSVNCVT